MGSALACQDNGLSVTPSSGRAVSNKCGSGVHPATLNSQQWRDHFQPVQIWGLPSLIDPQQWRGCLQAVQTWGPTSADLGLPSLSEPPAVAGSSPISADLGSNSH